MVPMVQENDNAQVTVKPEDDARLSILEAQIDRDWSLYRKSYYRELKRSGKLQQAIRETALWCMEILHQFQNRGLNPDQAREVIQELIVPQPGR